VIQITPQMRVLVAIEAVDGRKGIDSLAQLCQEKLQADPFSGCLFVFRSRRGTSIRILVYDGQGFWLAQKRLSKGALCVVAERKPAHAGTTGPSGAVVAGRGEPGCDRGAGVAAGERVINEDAALFTCVPFFTLPH
jgi:transposase